MNKKYLFLLLLIDLISTMSFWYYQPLCEPCLDNQDCPPCWSEEQYFLIYLCVGINLLLGLYYFYRSKKGFPLTPTCPRMRE